MGLGLARPKGSFEYSKMFFFDLFWFGFLLIIFSHHALLSLSLYLSLSLSFFVF